jgi:hypothetical protein
VNVNNVRVSHRIFRLIEESPFSLWRQFEGVGYFTSGQRSAISGQPNRFS